jgi:mRNA interferase MazF
VSAAASSPGRGEVWLVDFDPTRGHEQAGRRPALVISTNSLNQSMAGLVVVLPLTSKDEKIRSHVRVDPPEAGLKVTSFVKCEDIRSVASERLSRRSGRVSAPTMRAVGETVRILLEL